MNPIGNYAKVQNWVRDFHRPKEPGYFNDLTEGIIIKVDRKGILIYSSRGVYTEIPAHIEARISIIPDASLDRKTRAWIKQARAKLREQGYSIFMTGDWVAIQCSSGMVKAAGILIKRDEDSLTLLTQLPDRPIVNIEIPDSTDKIQRIVIVPDTDLRLESLQFTLWARAHMSHLRI